MEPTPSGPSQTARRSARQVGEGFDEAVAAEKDGRSAPSRPSKGGLSFSVSSSEAAPADAEEAAEIIAAAEAAAALDGPRGKTRESLAFLEAKLRAGPVGASAVGREWPSTARRDGKAEKAADDSSVEAPAAVSAAAKQPAGVSAWDGAAWPDVSNLTYGGLAGARWVDPLHGAAAAALATNRSGSLKNSRRHLLGQLTTLVQFDLRGDGLGVAVDLTTAVIDPGTVRAGARGHPRSAKPLALGLRFAAVHVRAAAVPTILLLPLKRRAGDPHQFPRHAQTAPQRWTAPHQFRSHNVWPGRQDSRRSRQLHPDARMPCAPGPVCQSKLRCRGRLKRIWVPGRSAL